CSLVTCCRGADCRGGRGREPLFFRLSSDACRVHTTEDANLHLAEEVRELLDGINAIGGPWRARVATVLLDVPGAGVCIPDLELTRDGENRPIHVEVLGFWSRDAV